MTTTSYLELDDQATGANDNTWGDVADANFAILEQAIARYSTITTTGGTTTLTSSQNRYPILVITGTLSNNAIIEVKTQQKNWIFLNSTTGSYTVTVKTSAGSGKVIPRGRAVKLYCDGTDVQHLRYGGIPAAQAGGTVDAITASFDPVTTSGEKQDGAMWIVEAAGANTSTTPTFNPDSLGAMTIKKNGGQALAAGDIRAAGHKLLLCYDASGGHVELLNPTVASLSAYAPLADPTFTGTPAGPTAAAYTNTTQLATCAQVYDTVTKVPENAQTGTTYTLVVGDKGKMVTLSNASAITLTVPASVFAAGNRVDIAQYGAGQVTVAAGAGMTIRSAGSNLKLTSQYSGATLWFVSATEAILFGDLSA